MPDDSVAAHQDDLTWLAAHFGTDKWGQHHYTPHYQRYFAPRRLEPLTLLEIGIGGYDNPTLGGESLRMWKAYFPQARIVGLDLHDKSRLAEERITIHRGDQSDPKLLAKLTEQYGGFDIVIDDGSHLNHHVIATFQALFPKLRAHGIYVVEDTQTAYWPSWGGGLHNPDNCIAYFKGLVDGLNHVEIPVRDPQPSYFDLNILEIVFAHNLVFIRKGDNSEPSNMPELVAKEPKTFRRPVR